MTVVTIYVPPRFCFIWARKDTEWHEPCDGAESEPNIC